MYKQTANNWTICVKFMKSKIYFSDKNILQERVEKAYYCFCQKFTVQALMARFKSVLGEIGSKA